MNDPAGHERDRAPVRLAQASAALREGAAVVLPSPAPLTHVIAATRARTVNEAKGRPGDQPVALWAHYPQTLQSLHDLWDVSADHVPFVGRLLTEEHVTVLVPLRAHTPQPSWLRPSAKQGWVLLFGARWQPLRPLLDEHPVLYVSSGNRTGRPPVATSEEALAMFPATVPVLEHPPTSTPIHDDMLRRQATTTVRVHPDGRLELHRHGAQDQSHLAAGDYLHYLRGRYAQP